ncbi:septal ring lytic transglycosylase RlpA family protein [Thermaerobacter subterraneus]|uniref:Probable endolytic peptidoglycan transglycosylase RlpA n=1 Tax=Thermaerobacter subterraneus DSM 13965 TaxID=867903 RepID=K6PPI0_9FIRM|nr:septal ring lytic transglycosylase RlpA family protein [Thermaerobacter subterraneus]EKP94827.1 rare lipoprotein A [Thermaerobacter subterraneus DSM 13965]
METARALGRALRGMLLVLAMGAAAGGAWPAAVAPPRSAVAEPVAVAGAAGAWVGNVWEQVQRLDDFAAFLAADTRAQWRGAAGSLREWGQAALPRLDDAVAAARDAVAATATPVQPVWQDLHRQLAGWWPPALPQLNPGGWSVLPEMAAGEAWPTLSPGGNGEGGGPVDDAPGPAGRGGPRPAGESIPALAGEGVEAGAGAGGAVTAGAVTAGALPDPVALIPDAGLRAEVSAQAAADQEADGQSGPGGGGGSSRGDGPGEPGSVAAPQDPSRSQEGAATGKEQDEAPFDRDAGAPAAERGAGPNWIPAVASWYGPGFYGRPTASGEIFTGREMTAAHRTMPFGTVLLVTYPETGRSVRVRINDRGPYVEGRDLDLSEAAAEALGMISAGVARVMYRVLRWGG